MDNSISKPCERDKDLKWAHERLTQMYSEARRQTRPGILNRSSTKGDQAWVAPQQMLK